MPNDRSLFYPESIRSGRVNNALYIYFKNLRTASPPGPAIYESAAEFINHDIRKANESSDTSEIEAAFTFLDNVIESEASKEARFIDFLNQTLSNEEKTQIPSSDEDWRQFVTTIQNRLHIGEEGSNNLKNELHRLKENELRYAYTDNLYYLQDTITKTQDHLKALLDAMTNKLNKTQGRKLFESILQKYGDRLLEFDSKGEIILNQAQVSSVIFEISAAVSEFYTSKYKSLGYGDANSFNEKMIMNILDDKEMDDKITELIERAKKMPFITNSLTSSIKFNPTNKYRKVDKQNIQAALNAKERGTELANAFIESLQGYQVPEETLKIIRVHNAYAEISSLVHFTLSKGAFGGFNIGGAGAKPDNLLGYLAVDLDAIDPMAKSQNLKKLEEIYNLISSLANDFKNTNTAGYYQEQQKKWNDITNQINKLIDSLDDNILLLKDCFLIEDSTKSYLSLYGRSKYDGILKDPHGGSLGARLDDQLAKIEGLKNTGAISTFSYNWLYAAILNSGPGMVGEEQKNMLETYLAAFVGILLFDDQLNIAAESVKNIKKSQTHVHKLHLFSVNNGYYPLSYVLKLTRDFLYENYNNIYNEVMSDTGKGIRVEIYGYVSEPNLEKTAPPDVYIQTWNNLIENAKKSTKLRMSFLINFMNVLDGLLNPSF